MEVREMVQQQENNIFKRKRLDARAYRKLYTIAVKKSKVAEAAPETRNKMLEDSHDNPESNCHSTGPESCHSHSIQQRLSSEVNRQSPAHNGVKMHDQYGTPLHGTSSMDSEERLAPLESSLSSTSKEETSHCKSSSPMLDEYWVPVEFSNVQLEQYCEILMKNTMLLCSSLQKGLPDVFHDILISCRKCCDHPYQMNQSLESFINEGRPSVDLLSTGIEVSGKLQLLDRFLQEIQGRGLRALIVFQQIGSPGQSSRDIGHILDDFIYQRFGENSYVGIYRGVDRSRKKDALDRFNNKESETFIMLMENTSCKRTIKVSSADVVILFNSDWNPLNDMKSLRKMTLHSQFDHLKVFRFYSPYTVEEKALILAKNGMPLGELRYFSQNICSMLLLRGCSYLFGRLDDFHGRSTNLNISCKRTLTQDVLHELSALLSCRNSRDTSSIILKVEEGEEGYSSNNLLHSERDTPSIDNDVPAYAFWASLLEGRSPQWKFSPRPSQTIRKRVQLCDNVSISFEVEGESYPKKRKISYSKDEVSCLNERIGVDRLVTWKKASRSPVCRSSSSVAGKYNSKSANIVTPHVANMSKINEVVEKDDLSNAINQIEEFYNKRMKELISKQKKEIREFYRAKREERAKLEEEHKQESARICKTCTETTTKRNQLNNLDHSFKEKLDKHDREKDICRKNLESVQLAARIREGEFKEKCLAVLKEKQRPRTLPSTASSSGPAMVSQNLKEMMQSWLNGSVDLGVSPNGFSMGETVLEESDREHNVAVKALKENTANSNDSLHVPLKESEPYVSFGEKSDNRQNVSDTAISGEASTGMRSPEELVVEAPDGALACHLGVSPNISPVGSVSGLSESKGDKDVEAMTLEEVPRSPIEQLNYYVLDQSNEPIPRPSSGTKESAASSNFVNRELQREGSGNMASPGRADKGETDVIDAADMGTVASEVSQNREANTMREVPSTDGAMACDLKVPPNVSPVGSVSGSSEANTDNVINQELEGEGSGNMATPAGPNEGETDVIDDVDLDVAASEVSQKHEANTLSKVLGAMESSKPPPCEPFEGEVSASMASPIRPYEGDIGLKDTADRGTAASEFIPQVEEHALRDLPSIMEQTSKEQPETGVPPEGTGAVNMETCGRTDEGGTDVRDVIDLDTDSDEIRQQSEVNTLRELPSTVDQMGNGQPQTYRSPENLSPLYQPVMSLNPPSLDMLQALLSTGGSRNGERTSNQLDQVQFPLMNPNASRNTHFAHPATYAAVNPYVAGRHPVVNRAAAPQFNHATISGFPQAPSFRNTKPQPEADPLQVEWESIRKLEEEATKTHADKIMQLKMSRDKEIEEIRKKYHMLMQDADTQFMHKKQDLSYYHGIVCANRLLAETVKFNFAQAVGQPQISQGVHSLIPKLPEFPTTGSSGVPAQIVHQMSELFSSNRFLLGTFSNPQPRQATFSNSRPMQTTLSNIQPMWYPLLQALNHRLRYPHPYMDPPRPTPPPIPTPNLSVQLNRVLGGSMVSSHQLNGQPEGSRESPVAL